MRRIGSNIRKQNSDAKARRIVRNIIRYSESEPPRNDYPKRIVSPPRPSRCCSDENREIVHVPQNGPEGLKAGDKVRCEIDWPRRHARMRVHTAMHLLSVLLPYPVTGGQVGDGAGRLDFDIEEAGLADKEELTAKLNELVAADEPVTSEWISDAELDAEALRSLAELGYADHLEPDSAEELFESDCDCVACERFRG